MVHIVAEKLFQHCIQMMIRITYGINVALGHMFHLHMFSRYPCNRDLNEKVIRVISCFLCIIPLLLFVNEFLQRIDHTHEHYFDIFSKRCMSYNIT